MNRDEIQALLKSGNEKNRLRGLRELAMARKRRVEKSRKEIAKVYQRYRNGETVATRRIEAINWELEREAELDRKMMFGPE